MRLLFHWTPCILALAIICFVLEHRDSNAAKSRLRQAKQRQGQGQVKKAYTRVLGLLWGHKNMPKWQRTILNWNLTDQLSGSQYMQNLYKNLSTDENNSQRFNVANVTTTKPVRGVDTIMGIQNDASDNKMMSTSDYNMRFKFDFTANMKGNESVEAAEFHLYKDISRYTWMQNKSFLVEVFLVTVPGKPSQLHTRLGARVVNGWETGWYTFDVTDTVKLWILSPKNNYGLELSVTSLNYPNPIRVRPANEFGFISFKGAYQKRPFIVSFFQGDPTERPAIYHASERRRRSVFTPTKMRYINRAGMKACRVRRLYVDFHALRWENWIIAPDGYEASFCDGACTYSMLNPRNASNHAIVQSLVNMFNPDTAPTACCAPTKVTAISVLYYDDKKNVILKKFKDMVVKSCGCH